MNQIIIKDYPDGWHSKHFLPLLKNQNRYLVLKGGGGSGKSHFIALKLLDRLLFENINHRLLLVRKTLTSIRKSSFQLIVDYIKKWQAERYFKINTFNMQITYLPNGNQILTAGMDDEEKLKSIERITGIWIEEATELTYDDFTQIDLRLRGSLETYKQILMSFNPVDEQGWINKIFFKRTKKNAYIDESTVDDNEFIDPEYIEVLDNLKDEDRNKYNIYRRGLWGKLENVIFTNYDIIDNYPDSVDEIIYGLDFGFNNPSALVEIGLKDTQPFIRELLYETKLTNSQLINKLNFLIKTKSDNIYADSAEPARIEEIRQAGFNIYPANKSVIDGIDYVKRHRLQITKDSSNVIKEISQYSYKKDKNGNILEEPIKFLDHLISGIRYALYTHSGQIEAISMSIEPESNYRSRF